MQPSTMIKDEKEHCQQIVFLSDARLVLAALEGYTLPHLMERIREVAKER